MSRWSGWLVLGLLNGILVCGKDFQLTQIEKALPSSGLEERIRFWQRMFTEFGEHDIVFHDGRDLRLIYAIVTVDRSVENDWGEATRQERFLGSKRDRLREILDDLSQGKNPTPRHVEVARLTRLSGYQPSPQLFRQLRDTLRFQRGRREKFKAGIVGSGRYLDHMEQVFRREGLPLELALLPHVVSSFRNEASSSSGALGIWQISSSRVNSRLEMNEYVDERLDPIQAAEAAAEILKEHYAALDSWPLAITAYNCGLSGMLQAKKALGGDLGTLLKEYQAPDFGFTARNFYAGFLAAVEVHKNSRDYFGPLVFERPLRFETIRLSRGLAVRLLATTGGLSTRDLRDYNPALTGRTWQHGIVPAGFSLRVPDGSAGGVSGLLENGVPSSSSGENGYRAPISYRVRPGETLFSIARTFGVSVESLQDANGIQDPSRIYAGQKLTIP